jgi:hypothetical protein
VAADKDEDDEGVMAFKTDTGWMPMVGADIGRVQSLKHFARALAEKTGKPYRVLKFNLVGEIVLDEDYSSSESSFSPA